MSGSEHREQAALIRWATLQAATRPELALLFAIPNGGARDRITGARLKAEGVKPGVPDLFLPVARRRWHGLFIELKTASGKPSEQQKQWLRHLSEQGYLAAVCHGWEPAKHLILDYLNAEGLAPSALRLRSGHVEALPPSPTQENRHV